MGWQSRFERLSSDRSSQDLVPGPAVMEMGDGSFFEKGRFGEATRVTGKMVQIHHGAATVSGE